MRKLITTTIAGALAISPVALEATGCVRGAIAGGVAGHYVGKGHAFLGAAAGCVAAHYYYANKAKQQGAARASATPSVPAH